MTAKFPTNFAFNDSSTEFDTPLDDYETDDLSKMDKVPPSLKKKTKRLHPALEAIDCLYNIPHEILYKKGQNNGTQIRRIRRKLGFTSEEFGYLLSISHAYLSAMEHNKVPIPKGFLLLITLMDMAYEEGSPALQRMVSHPKKHVLLQMAEIGKIKLDK